MNSSTPQTSAPLEPSPADDALAKQLRGFGPAGVLAALVVIALSGLLGPLRAIPVLLWTALSRTSWPQMGFVRGPRVALTVVTSLVFGVAFKLLLKSLVFPLLHADPVNHAFHYLVGNRDALPGILFMVIAGAGFGEELLFRSFLFERLEALLGRGAAARVAIVLLTSVLFSAAHLPEQGWLGAEQALITGLVFGSIYARGRRIWPLMIAHASFDVTAIAIIYWNLEERLAHLFIK